jgi:hypothetical protein
MITLTVVRFECLCPFLLISKDEVNPEVKALGHILTLQSITTLAHKVVRVYQPIRRDEPQLTASSSSRYDG